MPSINLFPVDDDQPAQVLQRVVASGLPLATGLRAYAEDCPTRARSGLLQLAASVESGTSISEAVNDRQLRLPVYLHGLIDGGLRSHCLGPMLEEYLHQRRRQRRMGQKVALDLAYPLLVLYFETLLCFAILIWLVPMFTDLYESFDVELPILTVVLIRLSKASLFLQFPLMVGFAMFGLLLLAFLFGGRWSMAWVDRLPFFGASARYAAMSEFCSLLAPLVETAVPLPEALHAVASTMQPSRLKTKTQLLAEHYDGSFELADFARAQKLPKEIVHLLRWEQRGSAFGEILRSWAELFARMSSGRSSVISAILAPLLMIGIGITVGLIVIALFLPLHRMMNGMLF